MIHMPGGLLEVFKKGTHHWHYSAEPQSNLNGRRLELYSGKTLGGSSSVNGMLYIRGSAKDYDTWAKEHGCTGWSYSDVLPHFKSTECQARGEDEYHGVHGELYVSDCPGDFGLAKLIDAFERAAIDFGIPAQPDFAHPVPEGVGRAQATIKDGRRWSASRAFLEPALSRPNLHLVTDAPVGKVIIEEGRTTGVEYSHNGVDAVARAKREVLLCAGAIKSPQIMMLSGLGPADQLEKHGIEVKHDLPGVGQNLHDHPSLHIHFLSNEPITLSGMSWLRKLMIGVKWTFFKSGEGSWNHFDGNLFTKSSNDLDQPDLQIQFIPFLAHGIKGGMGGMHGVSFIMCGLSEKSRGYVRLNSADPSDAPSVSMNYLIKEVDYQPLREGIRICRELVRSHHWGNMLGDEVRPGADIQTDDELDEFIRGAVDTDFHYAGTCKMGAVDDESAVVTPELKVKGVEGLRIADASIMPLPLHGNTNAPCIMIGEKLAQFLIKSPVSVLTH